MRIVRVYALLWGALGGASGGEISGVVRDTAEVPIAGARVEAVTYADGRVRLQAVTDREGRFRFYAPSGIYAVKSSIRWFQEEWSEPFHLGESGARELILRLHGEPIGDGPAWIEPDSNGAYSFESKPDDYVLRISIQGQVVSEQLFSAPAPIEYFDRITIQ